MFTRKLYLLALALSLGACATKEGANASANNPTSTSQDAYTTASPMYYYVAADSAALYANPNNAKPVRTIRRGDQVMVMGSVAPDWLVLKRDGATYYSKSGEFTTTRPQSGGSTAPSSNPQ